MSSKRVKHTAKMTVFLVMYCVSMNVGNHQMTGKAAVLFGSILRTTETLEGVYLPCTRFGKGAFQEFLEGLFSNPNKQIRFTVDLSDCNLKAQGARLVYDTIGKRKVCLTSCVRVCVSVKIRCWRVQNHPPLTCNG